MFNTYQKHSVLNNELIINVQDEGIDIALLEDKKLVEYHKENGLGKYQVGDIYLAKVKKVMPGLNAAFVDVGFDKAAFLHYQDLGAQFKAVYSFTRDVLTNSSAKKPQVQEYAEVPILEKKGEIKDVLAVGQEILVQIVKEPISTKGPRLTTEISIAGRALVLIPLSDKIFLSQKLKGNAEKKRIKQILTKIKPKNFGLIVRTMAEGMEEEDFQKELDFLLEKWDNIVAGISRENLPKQLHQEADIVTGLLRDSFSPSYDSIVVNHEEEYEIVKNYVRRIAPEKENIVELYNGNISLFDHYGVTRQLKSSFGRMVSFKNSAYLVIEHTEALHVIDVNSGNKTKASNDQETNALEVNLAAADEIARQLRLRDIGGIIVIDFIDLLKGENKQALFDRMKQNMAKDKARHNILPLSKFCLMQITRQRVRPVMKVDTNETCPTCMGTGKARPSICFENDLEEAIRAMKEDRKVKDFSLHVNPYVYAYISKGFFFNSLKWKWKRKYGSFSVYPDESLGMLQFVFKDSEHNDITNPAEEEETYAED